MDWKENQNSKIELRLIYKKIFLKQKIYTNLFVDQNGINNVLDNSQCQLRQLYKQVNETFEKNFDRITNVFVVLYNTTNNDPKY